MLLTQGSFSLPAGLSSLGTSPSRCTCTPTVSMGSTGSRFRILSSLCTRAPSISGRTWRYLGTLMCSMPSPSLWTGLMMGMRECHSSLLLLLLVLHSCVILYMELFCPPASKIMVPDHLIYIFQTPCCDTAYDCRFCHDDAVTNHILDRQKVMKIECFYASQDR